MNLVSCEGCGIVLDKLRLHFPQDFDNLDGSIDITKAKWNGYDYIPFVECPMCQEYILEVSGE